MILGIGKKRAHNRGPKHGYNMNFVSTIKHLTAPIYAQ
jgi:hypothetical protein